jgi:hypothetical protein
MGSSASDRSRGVPVRGGGAYATDKSNKTDVGKMSSIVAEKLTRTIEDWESLSSQFPLMLTKQETRAWVRSTTTRRISTEQQYQSSSPKMAVIQYIYG